MSVQVQLRRDSASNIGAVAGAQGEVWVDTTNNRLRVNDGAKQGGWAPLGKSPATIVEGIDGTGAVHGGNIQFACAEELLSGLSGASVASTISFPNQCLIIGVSCRVVTAITGATSFEIGRTGGAVSEFGTIGITAGTTNSGILGNPNGNYAATTVTLTAVGGSFTAGAVRIQLNYILLNPPTS